MGTMDREVLRLVLMEQCEGNLDNAVEALLAMQSSSNQMGGTQAIASSKSTPSKSRTNEVALFDNLMRPITVSMDFLQPPSFYLSKDYGLSVHQISNLQIQNDAVQQSSTTATPKTQRISIDASIINQWTNLMKRYKFKNQATMERISKMECKSLNRCGSLVRVIFMMKLYNRLCNESGAAMNEKSGELMHEYLSRGFKEYSLIQLINDCNHLMQYHQFGGEHLKNMVDESRQILMRSQMREYFGHCDVMNCKIIQRILARQEMNEENKDKMTDIEVET